MSEKIKPQHLSRKAILYVRQSSQYQVLNNLESQKLQYAMESQVRSFGWNDVEVIDEDLGRSAVNARVAPASLRAGSSIFYSDIRVQDVLGSNPILPLQRNQTFRAI